MKRLIQVSKEHFQLIALTFVLAIFLNEVIIFIMQTQAKYFQNDFLKKPVADDGPVNVGCRYCIRKNLHIDVRPKLILQQDGKFKDPKIFDTWKRIPFIIHQTNKDQKVSIIFKEWMKTWLRLHPKWEYWFWTDEDIKHFMTTRYPNFNNTFSAYVSNIHRSDAFRLFALHEFGGVYADCDVECLKPLDAIINQHECIISSEPVLHQLISQVYWRNQHLLSNAVMASHPRHLFFKFTIDFISRGKRPIEEDPVMSTGPMALEDSFMEFAKRYPRHIHPFAPESDVFLPKFNPRLHNKFIKLCKEVRKKDIDLYHTPRIHQACEKILPYEDDLSKIYNGPTEESYTVHHWTGTWDGSNGKFYLKGLKNGNEAFDVKDLL